MWQRFVMKTAAEQDYVALRHDAGAVWLPRDFVVARGPEAVTFLQGQLSQDVAALEPGQSVLSFLLQPQGKVDALLRVTRTGSEEIVLDTDAGWGEAVLNRLERFKLRVKCDLERLAWRCLAVRGARAHQAAPGVQGDTVVVPADWPGLPGIDLLGEDPQVPEGVPLCGVEAYEAVRIEAGVPRMGSELTERTIPAETGLIERTVSFTKGCYTGQELVARIDARGGNVPRRLRGVLVEGDVLPPPGARVEAAGREVGTLASVAHSPGLGTAVALAFVGRAVEPPAAADLVWDGGRATARIEALPLVS
jgi:folate-binding protein YgfZ